MTPGQSGGAGGGLMVRSAMLLAVVVSVAIVAGGADGNRSQPDFPTFLGQLERGEVRSVELRQKDNTANVQLDDGTRYKIGTASELA
jgi:hypothetical protein